jgi:hypothetical protein
LMMGHTYWGFLAAFNGLSKTSNFDTAGQILLYK